MEPAVSAAFGKIEEAIPHLLVGDIILMRYRRGRVYRAIREASRSYWNHAALVFDRPVVGGHRQTLIIEALPRGIEIHRLEAYVADPATFDIGIKRMKGLTDEERERFRGFFLDAVDTPYDMTRLLAYLFRSAIAKLAGAKRTEYLTRRIINVGNFVCTSFAQRAFWLAAAPNKRDRMLFREDGDLNFLYQLEYITPGDIARSRNTAWLYNPHE